MSYRFNSSTVKEDGKEVTLKCRLDGFKPSSGHSASAQVTDNTLIVQANKDGNTYEMKIRDIDVSDDAVSTKPAKDEIKVVIRKPNSDYSLASKMPR